MGKSGAVFFNIVVASKIKRPPPKPRLALRGCGISSRVNIIQNFIFIKNSDIYVYHVAFCDEIYQAIVRS